VPMYKDYRLDIKILSPMGTPWQSDIIMGHLAFTVALERGDSGVKEFLAPFLDGDPPFVVSDGFPEGLLPRPLTPVSVEERELSVEETAEAKRLKRMPFLSVQGFEAVRRGSEQPDSPVESPWKTFEMLHATLDRRSDSTGGEGEGNLFPTVSEALDNKTGVLSVYVRAKTDRIDQFYGLLRALSKVGFGRDKSVGNGRFEVASLSETMLFESFEGADGFISLSTWVPAASDPTAGYWRLHVKRGKLGEMAGGDNPFKRPLIQFLPGSVFHTGGDPNPWYGRVVRDIAAGMPEAVQICYCLAVPCVFPTAV